jgi:hypothetical protein
MPDRHTGARPAPTWSGVLRAVADRITRTEERISALESHAGQSLPPDYRFETNEAGQLVIRRVSTGDTAVIDV